MSQFKQIGATIHSYIHTFIQSYNHTFTLICGLALLLLFFFRQSAVTVKWHHCAGPSLGSLFSPSSFDVDLGELWEWRPGVKALLAVEDARTGEVVAIGWPDDHVFHELPLVSVGFNLVNDSLAQYNALTIDRLISLMT